MIICVLSSTVRTRVLEGCWRVKGVSFSGARILVDVQKYTGVGEIGDIRKTDLTKRGLFSYRLREW